MAKKFLQDGKVTLGAETARYVALMSVWIIAPYYGLSGFQAGGVQLSKTPRLASIAVSDPKSNTSQNVVSVTPIPETKTPRKPQLLSWSPVKREVVLL